MKNISKYVFRNVLFFLKLGAHQSKAGMCLVSENCFGVDICMYICMFVCVCVSAPDAIYNWWCDVA